MGASLIALLVGGGAFVLTHTEAALSIRATANRVADTRSGTAYSAKIPLQASTASLVPIGERAPLLPAKAAPVPHDSSSISFNAAIFHASARQTLVAITVRRSPANENPGEFVWRVERGNAVPSIDYERIAPQRVSFNEGQMLRTLFIPLLNKASSRMPFGPRFFDVVLQPVAGGPSLGRFARITVVIDPASTVWVANSEPPSTALR